MRSTPFLILAGLGLAASAATVLAHPQAKVQPARATGETPGMLTTLDRTGKPVGVCPLRHTDIQATIAGFVARVSVTQEFEGPQGGQPVEALYTFPLPENAAVDDMTLTIGQDRVIKGELKERDAAREAYEAARAEGKTAALLDQERPNIFTQAVANLMPGQRVKVTIRYVVPLKYDSGKYTFVHPIVVGPRFVGAQSASSDPQKLTPPITPPGTRAGHDIALTVTVDAGLPLTELASPLHDIKIQRLSDNRAKIRLADHETIPNKDFILRYSAAGSELQEGLLVQPDGKGGGYFTLMVQPPQAPRRTEVTPKEMVFVIDQTGSQMGAPIEKAKETMAYCIRNLNPGDTFQLLGFNTAVYPCFPKPVPATQENIEKALAYLKPLAGAGGTDILKAADYALSLPDDPNRVRIICYMTDGYVGNDREIIGHVRRNCGRARVFPFGVGNSVNRFLIEGMAREGRGVADFVDLKQPGEAIAATFYRRVADPLLTDITVDWGGLPVSDVFPRQIPDVFSAAPLVLKGRYAQAGSGEITVRGKLRGKPYVRKIALNLAEAGRAGAAFPLATLWAREKIEALQSDLWAGDTTEDPKNQIIHLALENRLMTEYTSFVAIEQKVVNVSGKQQTIAVPVEMPDGVSYEGIFGREKEVLALQRGGLGVARFAERGLVGGGGGGFGKQSQGLPAVKAKVESLSDLKAGYVEEQRSLSPEQRRQYVLENKLSAKLRPMAGKGVKQKKQVQLWLLNPPKDALAQLKALGFTLQVELRTGKLLLGEVSTEKLVALAELEWVWRIDEPQVK